VVHSVCLWPDDVADVVGIVLERLPYGFSRSAFMPNSLTNVLGQLKPQIDYRSVFRLLI
jgi:hypothetical protein